MCALVPLCIEKHKFYLADEGVGFTYYQFAQIRATLKKPIIRSPTHARATGFDYLRLAKLIIAMRDLLEDVEVLESSYRLNAPACIAEAVEDDLIIINLDSGRYYNIRHQTVEVWHALSQGVSPAELLQANDWNAVLQDSFKNHIQFLLDEGLLVPSDDSVTQTAAQAEVPKIDLAGADNTDTLFHADVFTDMQEMLLLDPIHDADANVGWPHKA